MHLRLLAASIFILLLAAAPAGAAGSIADPLADPPPSTGPATIVRDHELIVTAGIAGSLEITDRPGTGRGRTVKCGWFELVYIGQVIVDLVQLRDPEIGSSYYLWCWYADDNRSLRGFPRAEIYNGPSIPGEPTSTAEAARFAVNSIVFVDPALELSPEDQQVVGIPSWLAVTSQLEYGQVSAQTGPVWATVRPVFREVEWAMGNGDTVTCTLDTDATTRWNPDGPESQTSNCTYLYESNGDGDGSTTVSATVNWTILQQTNLNPAWTTWGTISLTSTVPITVRELQAVVN